MQEFAVISQLAYAYLSAKEYVIRAGFAHELEWQQSLDFDQVTESDFLRESAWVILSGGMRESVIRTCFPAISASFLDWKDATEIKGTRERCISSAIKFFNHPRKIRAIADVASQVSMLGIEGIKNKIRNEGVDFLKTLPHVGLVTSFHLAKNLGFDVVKPDRHLMRVAAITGYSSPYEMCQAIASVVGDKLCLIDLVIWRFATIKRDYLDTFDLPAMKAFGTVQKCSALH